MIQNSKQYLAWVDKKTGKPTPIETGKLTKHKDGTQTIEFSYRVEQ